MIAFPARLRPRMISNRPSRSAGVRLEVGSSKAMMRPPRASARAISTIWRSAMPRSPTLANSPSGGERIKQAPRRRALATPVGVRERGALPQKNVLRDVELRNDRGLLGDERDALGERLAGIGDAGVRAAADHDVAAVVAEDPETESSSASICRRRFRQAERGPRRRAHPGRHPPAPARQRTPC